MSFKASEMPLKQDGSVYHLHLLPHELAHKIILVGDPARVALVSSFFDTIEVKKQNREIITHTGVYQSKRISVISTGMGTDNIDIVINELDALVNIDLEKKIIKENHTSLEIVRIGTCGALQEDIAIDNFIASLYGLGLDGLLHYYEHKNISDEDLVETFISYSNWNEKHPRPYAVSCADNLLERIAFDIRKGITLTASGFYAPQCRVLRLPLSQGDFIEKLNNKHYKNTYFTNMEMETSALYALSKLLNHNSLTVCLVVANRVTKMFSTNYQLAMERLIKTVLDRI